MKDTRQPGWTGPLDTAVMFVDLVDSSVFSSVLDLKAYSDYVHSFQATMREQCEYFFGEYLEGSIERGTGYSYSIVGDELVVFLHTSKSANDVYLLTILAITLKAAWLLSPVNRERVRHRAAAAEIAVGINFGQLWAQRTEDGYEKEGYVINLAKRIESHSRHGEHYRIFLSDGAFKQIHTRMRNLLFGPRTLISGKGIVGQFGVYEIVDSFANVLTRLSPQLAIEFEAIMEEAIDSTSRDLWIHSAYQLASESTHGRVTAAAAKRCQAVLNYDPSNPVALYHLAQHYRDSGQHPMAAISYSALLDSWPTFGDGFLEQGDCLAEQGEVEAARDAYRRASRLGITEAEDKLAKLD